MECIRSIHQSIWFVADSSQCPQTTLIVQHLHRSFIPRILDRNRKRLCGNLCAFWGWLSSLVRLVHSPILKTQIESWRLLLIFPFFIVAFHIQIVSPAPYVMYGILLGKTPQLPHSTPQVEKVLVAIGVNTHSAKEVMESMGLKDKGNFLGTTFIRP